MEPIQLADCLPPAVKAMLVTEHARTVEQDRAHDEALWRDGYQAGFHTGYEMGHDRAHIEMAGEWSRVHQAVKNIAARRTSAEVAEMLRRDVAGEPCAARCEKCSVCIRANSVAHRGGDYMGRDIRTHAA
jgi:hypothetical protein